MLIQAALAETLDSLVTIVVDADAELRSDVNRLAITSGSVRGAMQMVQPFFELLGR